MGMALRAGELAAPLCSHFLAGEILRIGFIQNYRKAWKKEFSRRLVLGTLLQRFALSPLGAETALRVLGATPRIGEWLIRQTRGPCGPAAKLLLAKG